MARVMCIDDYPFYSEMVGSMLERKGSHTVKSDIVPINMDDLRAFKPDVVIINLVRKMESISVGGMRDFYTEVEGARAFRTISEEVKSGDLKVPILITSLAVSESDLPPGLAYLAFIEIPQKMELLLTIINKLAEANRTGSKVAPE